MRWIGPSLLVLALVFTTGGVAIVGQAGSTAEGQSAAPQNATPAEQSAPAQTEQGACEAPQSVRRAGPSPRQVLRDAPGNKSIVLNTSGYNYTLEGEWRPAPTAQPQGVPEGVLPGGAKPKGPEAAPPAAPDAK